VIFMGDVNHGVIIRDGGKIWLRLVR